MTRIAAPALIVMLAVAGFVAAAGWNMSGEPRGLITLTERELQLPVRVAPPGDDPGLQLRIAYEGRYDPLDSRNWLPESRLREIGFALHVPVGAPQAVHTYDHVPARLAWVVFEHDGPQWREIERRRELRESASGPQRFPHLQSRLVPVDAGADFDALRLRYPSHLIMRGVIGLSYVTPENGGPLLHGMLREVVPQQVAVPQAMKGLFDALPRPGESSVTEPRYEAELAIGELGLPYLRSVRLRE
jgi:hypothetical protein